MVNARKNSVAENGMAMGVAFMHMLKLEKKMARLRHYMSVLSKRLDGRKEKGREEEKEEVAVQNEVVAEVAAVGVSPITSGTYKVVAEC